MLKSDSLLEFNNQFVLINCLPSLKECKMSYCIFDMDVNPVEAFHFSHNNEILVLRTYESTRCSQNHTPVVFSIYSDKYERRRKFLQPKSL